MCRGSTMACSIKTVGSPKAPWPRACTSRRPRGVLGVVDPRMPRPPPPATALTNRGTAARGRSPPACRSVDGSTDASVGRAVHRPRHAGGVRPAFLPYPLSSRRSPAEAAGHAPRRRPADLREARRGGDAGGRRRFGDPTVFLEQAVIDPRHIEVQILADAPGDVIHLFERDCSVQRRHQKVVEIAPAPNLAQSSATGCAPTPCGSPREIGYRNAGTVEFLLDPDGQLRLHRDEPPHPGRAHRHRGGHRRRPRAVADADRVRRDPRGPRPRARTRSAARRGAAVPHHHRGPRQRLPARHRQITTYRSPGGAGIRLDGGTTYTGAEISRALRLDARQAHLPRPRLRAGRASGPGGRSRSSGSAASRRTSRSCRPCSTTRTSRPAGVTTVVHRGAPAAAHRALERPTAAPSC